MEQTTFAFGGIVVAGLAVVAVIALVVRFAPALIRRIPKWVFTLIILAIVGATLMMVQASYDRLVARGLNEACTSLHPCLGFLWRNMDAVRVGPFDVVAQPPRL